MPVAGSFDGANITGSEPMGAEHCAVKLLSPFLLWEEMAPAAQTKAAPAKRRGADEDEDDDAAATLEAPLPLREINGVVRTIRALGVATGNRCRASRRAWCVRMRGEMIMVGREVEVWK